MMQIWWVALGEYQASSICHLYKLGKTIWSSQIMPNISKILQNFWFTQLEWVKRLKKKKKKKKKKKVAFYFKAIQDDHPL